MPMLRRVRRWPARRRRHPTKPLEIVLPVVSPVEEHYAHAEFTLVGTIVCPLAPRQRQNVVAIRLLSARRLTSWGARQRERRSRRSTQNDTKCAKIIA